MELTDPEYWDNCYSNFSLQKCDDNNAVYRYIEKHIPKTDNNSSLEIGSYPGSFTAKFGDLGYNLNGIDLYHKNSSLLVEWLNNLGYSTGDFYVGDFFIHDFSTKYDLVASFGFIEHFSNYKDVIIRHLGLVKNNGYIIITTPNYNGFIQRILHSFFARNDFEKHYIPSMKPKIWKKIIESSGFEIVHSGYFGGFKLWIPLEKKTFFNRLLFRVVYKLSNWLSKLLFFESSVFSQYCGVVAKQNTP